MKSAYSHFAKNCAQRVIWTEMVLTLLVAIGAWRAAGMHGAISALLGGLVWFLPTLIFLFIFLIRKAERSPIQIVSAFYLGEMAKFFISILLIVLVVSLYKIRILPFFAGYILNVLSVWIVIYFELRAERI